MSGNYHRKLSAIIPKVGIIGILAYPKIEKKQWISSKVVLLISYCWLTEYIRGLGSKDFIVYILNLCMFSKLFILSIIYIRIHIFW